MISHRSSDVAAEYPSTTSAPRNARVSKALSGRMILLRPDAAAARKSARAVTDFDPGR
jgi:hypothetical protein